MPVSAEPLFGSRNYRFSPAFSVPTSGWMEVGDRKTSFLRKPDINTSSTNVFDLEFKTPEKANRGDLAFYQTGSECLATYVNDTTFVRFEA